MRKHCSNSKYLAYFNATKYYNQQLHWNPTYETETRFGKSTALWKWEFYAV